MKIRKVIRYSYAGFRKNFYSMTEKKEEIQRKLLKKKKLIEKSTKREKKKTLDQCIIKKMKFDANRIELD